MLHKKVNGRWIPVSRTNAERWLHQASEQCDPSIIDPDEDVDAVREFKELYAAKDAARSVKP